MSEHHNAYATKMMEEGWSYGEARDAHLKTSPLVRVWDAMSPKYRKKQELLFGTIRAMIHQG